MMRALSITIDRYIRKIDSYQRLHKSLAFLFALIKKYSEDEGGYKAALLTYYAFLSLFPLLLVLTSLLRIFLHQNPEASSRIISAITVNVPVIGGELESNIHGLGTTGLALLVGILITLYGARGVADVLSYSLDHFWAVPYKDRPGFPTTLLRSLRVISVGGLGLMLTTLLPPYALAFVHGLFLQLLSVVLSALILFGVILYALKSAASRKLDIRSIWLGSAVATIGLELLLLLGRLIVTRELKHLNNLYGTFAIVLGLFYWIYLQAQVLMYGLELDTVRAYKLWPRGMQQPLTEGDLKAYRLYADRSEFNRETTR